MLNSPFQKLIKNNMSWEKTDIATVNLMSLKKL